MALSVKRLRTFARWRERTDRTISLHVNWRQTDPKASVCALVLLQRKAALEAMSDSLAACDQGPKRDQKAAR